MYNFQEENHIFVQDRSLFEYVYCTHGNRVNFVIGIGEKSERIYAIRGYICSNFNDNPDAWGAIWKKADYAPRGLGRKLQVFLIEELEPRVLVGISISKQGLAAREKLKEQRGKLKHYYRLGKEDEYKIAVVKNKNIKPINKKNQYDLIRIPTMENLKEVFDSSRYRDRICYKDDWYIERRYFMFPYYQYIVFGISKNSNKFFDSIIIAREVTQNGVKILRIVDFIGLDEDLAGLSSALDKLINKNRYEYIDFYQHGIPKDIMESMGMTLKDHDDPNIIPNYFEPFKQVNIDIDFSATDITNLYVFKGDSDQDRPNIIK